MNQPGVLNKKFEKIFYSHLKTKISEDVYALIEIYNNSIHSSKTKVLIKFIKKI